MKWIKLFEDFKNNNEEGTLITQDDIINCIKKRGLVYATIVKDFPENNPKEGMTPVDIDEDGLVTVEYEGKEYTIDLNDIEKIEF
jgi:hypothetical protein